MLSIIGLIILGLVVMAIGAYGMKFSIDIDNFVFASLLGLFSVLLIPVGFTIPFTPLMQKSSADETLNMQACKNVGGRYEVIDQTWNGKFYTNIYGCIKQ